jgi:hypothetical protein
MMSVSQFQMAVLLDEDRKRLRVCGTLATGEGRLPDRAEIYVVVHQHTNDQGLNIVKGRGHYEGDRLIEGDTTNEGDRISEWEACLEAPQPLSLGKAMGTAIAVVERENPGGFTTQTWIGEFDIKIPSQLTGQEALRLEAGEPCAESSAPA